MYPLDGITYSATLRGKQVNSLLAIISMLQSGFASSQHLSYRRYSRLKTVAVG
jgi:hypothetical protein